ncbi:XisH protein domain-conaining protein [Desulfonema limicola]|uniref:XisH protein domain-conaining protein n=1 Tax=Desulfonema limicola TaxID=45656 RepID=A0A975GI43_9BACT|nr:XisH family protein [Desulfonema limicola]QTA81478.1 XisH protein domain-conaining protein [Desulfonema limicola]
MPAKDIYHNHVKSALIKDGWTITHDPLAMKWGTKDMYADLGAEKILAAEKKEQKIAVEVKSFVGVSIIKDLRDALGQYVLYHDILKRTEPDRILYLAIRQAVFLDIFEEPVGQLLLENQRVRLIVFNHRTEEVIKWIP